MCNCKKKKEVPTPVESKVIKVEITQPVLDEINKPDEIDYFNNIDTIEPIED